MNYIFVIVCVISTLPVNEGFHRSIFDGIQEVENVQISHSVIHRRRRESITSTTLPSNIITKIKRDNEQTYLKFQHKKSKTLSPLLSLGKDWRMTKMQDASKCIHFYEDSTNFAHAIVDSCNKTGHVNVVAEIVLNGEVYIILPKDSEGFDESVQHGLFKINTTRNYMFDYNTAPEKETTLDETLPRFNHRFKRQSERTYVELMIVVDYSLYNFWYELATGTGLEREASTLDLIQKMYSFLGNGVNLRFKNLLTSFGLDIEVELTSVYVMKTAEESAITMNVDFQSSTRGAIDAETLLNNFQTWIAQQKVSNSTNFPNNDHFMLLTGREILLSGNAAAAGYAYNSTICTSQSMSVVEDKFNFLSFVTAAHELGHSLGGQHDGDTGDANCKDENGFILSAINAVYTDSRATHPWKFSPCSANAFQSKLTSLQGSANNCLKRDDVSSLLLPTGSPPGQLFPPDKQCQLMLDSGSVMWRQRHYGAFDRMCTAMACTQLGLTKITFVVPGDGTTCGNKKWCWDGNCVYSDDAPTADESCLHGDQTGAFLSGSTCAATLSGDSIWKCYQANIEETCCGTCKARASDIEGCLYGDKSNCSQINSIQCYNANVLQSCCKTCYDISQQYTMLPSDCKYGDKLADCQNSVSVCTKYKSDCCATCAGFVAPSTEPPPSTSSSLPTSDSGTSSQFPISSDTTRATQTPSPTVKPEEQEGLPKWVIPVAAGGGGLIVVSIIIALCTYCMKTHSGNKYKDKSNRKPSDDRNRQRSNDTRRKSEDLRQPRRYSEDTRQPYMNYDRRYSTPTGRY